MSKKTVILGLGNILLKDEGIGVHVIKELEKKSLPDNVELIDGGTSSLDILLSIENTEKLIIIDALKFGKDPGTIYKIDPKDLEEKIDMDKLSLHQMNLLETLLIAKTKGTLPEEIVILGVEPFEISSGLGLTPKLQEKLPKVIDAVLNEINTLEKAEKC